MNPAEFYVLPDRKPNKAKKKNTKENETQVNVFYLTGQKSWLDWALEDWVWTSPVVPVRTNCSPKAASGLDLSKFWIDMITPLHPPGPC